MIQCHPARVKRLTFMRLPFIQALLIALIALSGMGAVIWLYLYYYGRRYALRDRLRKADAIVALAGTLGDIRYLDSKVDTAVRLYHENWAPLIIFAGRFSHQATDTPQLISAAELEAAVRAGRIDQESANEAVRSWDVGLDARYMRDRAIRAGVPATAILTENNSLHTMENAQFTMPLLAHQNAHRIILVAAPFHQLRSYLTFSKVYRGNGIDILNYAADTSAWRPFRWFLSSRNRELVRGEAWRIKTYRAKGYLR